MTPKGPSGLNVSRAYTESKRSFDKSMMGIMAISTSPKYLGLYGETHIEKPL